VKQKHLQAHVEVCLVISKLSGCPRRKFGAVIINPERNTILATGYNGAPRGGGSLCGGEECLRDTFCIKSGTHTEVGCHHAEMNAITNAAADGIRTAGSWMIVSGEPCVMCAKLLHHAGIEKLICVRGGFVGGGDGPAYLSQHGVEVAYVEGPQDPRSLT
jgi:dCMP deaminase